MMKKTLLVTVMLTTFCVQGADKKINKECSDFPIRNLDAMVQSSVDKCNTYGVSIDSDILKRVLSPGIETSQVMSSNSCITQCQEKVENGNVSAQQCVQGLIEEGVKGFGETFTNVHLISAKHCIAVNNNMKKNIGK